MKVNRVIAILFSAAFVVAAGLLIPAPKAGVALAVEDKTKVAETVETKDETGTEVVAEPVEDTADDKAEDADKTEEEAKETDENLTPEEKAIKEAEAARKALQKDPNHIHHYRWIAKMNESESADGTMNYMCADCDKVLYFRPIPAYYAFEGDVARRIEVAPEGITLKVKTSHFINFNRQVMEALAARPDVSVYVSFLDQEYKGNRVSFVIPAGEDTTALLDENGYVGFLYLGGKYGLKMEVPMEADDTAEDAEAAEEAVTEQTDKTNDAVSSEQTDKTEDTVSPEKTDKKAE